MKQVNENRSYEWLPTSIKEVKRRGWDQLDVILFTGDAYIDHPAFGAAVIGRLMESMGYKVAIVPQPNWRDDLRDFKKLGEPKLFFGVTSGAMDSMVNHYTANKRLRSDDAYTAGGKAGNRPDYATTIYSNIIKSLYPHKPLIIGGIEASLRRVTHFDYWSGKLRPPILCEANADLLVYGMGEFSIKQILKLIDKGVPFSSLDNIEQTVKLYKRKEDIPSNKNWDDIWLYPHEECLIDKKKYALNFRVIEEESNKWKARRVIQETSMGHIVITPPFPPMKPKQIDEPYDLPYTRLPHPRYKDKNIPAYEMIKYSINMHRGCFGGCSFCTISAHQGKFIASRSPSSILKEVDQITQMSGFKGYISDMGGPSANMYNMKGKLASLCQQCKRPSCIYPSVCKNLDTDHMPMVHIYKEALKKKGVKKVFVGSGVRYDLLYNEKATDTEKQSHECYKKELITNHVSGRLKVAPEHTSNNVLKLMRKPDFNIFRWFKKDFDKINKKHNLKQQLIPYFISSHPGSQDIDMANLAVATKNMNFRLEQVQDFTPTPMTLSTVIYYAGFNPYNDQMIYTAKDKKAKLEQRKFFFWYKSSVKDSIRKTLGKINRLDLYESLIKK